MLATRLKKGGSFCLVSSRLEKGVRSYISRTPFCSLRLFNWETDPEKNDCHSWTPLSSKIYDI